MWIHRTSVKHSHCLTVWLLSCSVWTAVGQILSPFFFVCNYHNTPDQSSLDSGEVQLSITIEGNPEFYVPDKMYQVHIASNLDFDGFLLTGLYTIPTTQQDSNPFPLNNIPSLGISSQNPLGQNFMCSFVHSHLSHQPKQQLSFIWKAPPKGTGCLSFLATATLGRDVLFKDTVVLQLCEEGAPELTPTRPPLAAVHTDGLILRDDFDTSDSVDNRIWHKSKGGKVSNECGHILHGNAFVFCGKKGFRELVTTPLNLTTSSVLQFAVGTGTCSSPVEDKDIVVSYAHGDCRDWKAIERFHSPVHTETTTHLLHLPHEVRTNSVCLRWLQNPSNQGYTGCWAIDNVLVINTADPPVTLQDNFDPMEPSNWLFFPGASVKHKCHADKNALVFDDPDQHHNFITSHDLNLYQLPDNAMLFEGFDDTDLEDWSVKGGSVSSLCGELDSGDAVYFHKPTKTRMLCTPFSDLTKAANLKFHFGMGTRSCHGGNSSSTDVFVFIEDKKGSTEVIYTLPTRGHQQPKVISIPIPTVSRKVQSRICWLQKRHGGEALDVWGVDSVQLTPHMPDKPHKYIQFSLHMKCGKEDSQNYIDLDVSTDHGLHWYALHDPCLPGTCQGVHQPLSSHFSAKDLEGWTRVTLPLPHQALSPFVRFRWKQPERSGVGNWAIDNVYIGHCEDGCSGHGFCTNKGCRCDFGYEGPACQTSSKPLPTYLIDTLTGAGKASASANFQIFRGASVNFDCGIVDTGKAAVFHKDSRRELVTVDLNTTSAKYLQFSVRVGSNSAMGTCPAPDTDSEAVLLHYSCTGGVTWQLLKELLPQDYKQPKVVLIHLPDNAQKLGCRFRWWQPEHSGDKQDVWALDDLSVTDTLYNAISVNFTRTDLELDSLNIHRGRQDFYCGTKNTLSFTDLFVKGESRYFSTNSLHIGPSYMIQFELVMGCGLKYSPVIDNRVYLEYSTDHGMTWTLVRKPCLPPSMCEEYQDGTTYDWTEFKQWRRVTVPLPQSTWSGSTRFRWIQKEWREPDDWAVMNLYIGQQCPHLCHGHGQCFKGQCRCDNGYNSTSCEPQDSLPSHLSSHFAMMTQLKHDWSDILGGEVVSSNQGCKMIFSGESMYFSQAGSRQLVSRDINTTDIDFVQFYIRIGGGNLLDCFGADKRAENVLVQYSNNGGITWRLLKELHHEDYRKSRFVHLTLPKSPSTRVRWWQPRHSGEQTDQWGVDEILFGKYENLNQMQDDFELPASGSDRRDNIWLTVTEGMKAPYCTSTDDTLMFANQLNDKVAITKDLHLKLGDVIQFRINVGCSQAFSHSNPVKLQFSCDAGLTWNLVQEKCYPRDSCDNQYHEETVYYTGTYGDWTLVVIPVTDKLAKGKVNFRWWQKGSPHSAFALDDVYIGPTCADMCSGHGICVSGKCQCNYGFTGANCTSILDPPVGLIERFDEANKPSVAWDKILGGQLGLGCGVIHRHNSMYFNGEGTREIRTKPHNTKYIRMAQFTIRIGSEDSRHGCRRPVDRNEAVIFDYSTDSGITWSTLKVLDPVYLSRKPQTVNVPLPADAKTLETVFRWWQPLAEQGSKRAEWAIDNVVIAVQDSSAVGFQENFNPMKNEVWYMAQNAVPRISCQSSDNALEFSKNAGGMRYAETWDYHVTPSTFLQFDIAMGCSGTFSTLYDVMLQFSVDMGRTWQPVVEQCLPPQMDCAGYHYSSHFLSESHKNWTRISLYLPQAAVSDTTRFRWLQTAPTARGNVWALDNVYLGEGCPWMCSGHGYCKKGKCVCDAGFTGDVCVPQSPLPDVQKDDFSQGWDHTHWPEIYGAEVTDLCGVLLSDKSLTFFKEPLRMAVTQDLDCSVAMFVQFYFRYGCDEDVVVEWQRTHSVILQYSNNGGISWHLMKEIHFAGGVKSRFYNVPLPTLAQTNATRFRFWQPRHDGHRQQMWSVDNVYIGGSMMNPDMLYETFGAEPYTSDWTFWPGGNIGKYCSFNIRPDGLLSGSSAIVFTDSAGEHSITTRDLTVNEMSVIQFDINVGCTQDFSHRYPIRLEYSLDNGKTWQLVSPPCTKTSMPSCAETQHDTSMYYSGMSEYWQRIVVPLTGTRINGMARFRWYQGHFKEHENKPHWALDNVYIGMQCKEHCGGHGTCINGMLCECDENYDGSECADIRRNPTFLKDAFEGDLLTSVDKSRWLQHSGGSRTSKCGQLLSGLSFHFYSSGLRALVTQDLDLTFARVVQFYLKLGCSAEGLNEGAEPVMLQFSTNGGIAWNTIEQFDFSRQNAQPTYIALNVPQSARTKATRVRWIQPTLDGTYLAEWAIDQVFIGGDIRGQMVLQDGYTDRHDANWLMMPGAKLQTVCDSPKRVLHFKGPQSVRYAETTDVMVAAHSYLQFEIMMRCTNTEPCYDVEVQFSVDLGKSWAMVEKQCLPSHVDCEEYHRSSVYSSSVYTGWHRVTVTLPYYTRSKATRFRWIQPRPFRSGDQWALGHVYIGDECLSLCSGHGRCNHGKCLCDTNWTSESCDKPVSSLLSGMTDHFSDAIDRNRWLSVTGGAVSKACGVLSAGTALYFGGGCVRQLITTDLDLRAAMFVQFYVKLGCYQQPEHRDEGVIVDYSTDGGISWKKLIELYHDQYRNPRFVTLDLPEAAKSLGVRIRWWQPHHPGKAKSDWAVDNVLIGGKEINPDALKDSFDHSLRDDYWLEKDNVHIGPYCGSSSAIVGVTNPDDEKITLTTIDMNIEPNYILQFSLSVGCNASWDTIVSPVQLRYSTDFGMSWADLIQGCLPSFPACDGVATTPSAYYPNSGWRRVTLLLTGQEVSRSTRFQWIQVYKKPLQHLNWGIDDVYIGPACKDMCSGHGRCDFPQCICDRGYGGHNCHLMDQRPLADSASILRTGTNFQKRSSTINMFLKDTFDTGIIDESKWSLVQGGTVSTGCGVPAQSSGLHFMGLGQRQAVTVDLDLRDARFVQYEAEIGGKSSKVGCGQAESVKDSVILQYSTNAGITWHTLHILDHTSYITPTHDYIQLPVQARTNSTSIRWWQLAAYDQSSEVRTSWTIDNVYIGGSVINPSQLYSTFDEGLNEKFWEFHPGAEVSRFVCGSSGTSLSWKRGSGSRSATTGQMIVQENYMLQFKIIIGCADSDHRCNVKQSVHLEYSKEPSSDNWELVQHKCMLGDNVMDMDCIPYKYHQGSIYTANTHQDWKRVTLLLPSKVFSSLTRFRWIQADTDHQAPDWALSDVYIGEQCPNMCNGRGECVKGTCHCDLGYQAPTCRPLRSQMISHIVEGFEAGISSHTWAEVQGGDVGVGCGVLLPYAHGKSLYFSGCGQRHLVSVELDTAQASKVMFVMQIGSHEQSSTCNVNLKSSKGVGSVILQYTKNKGIDWHLITTLKPQEFLRPKRVLYDIPADAQDSGVQFRWWQPEHGGHGHDQWAVDHIEIVMTYRDQMLRTVQKYGHGRKHPYRSP